MSKTNPLNCSALIFNNSDRKWEYIGGQKSKCTVEVIKLNGTNNLLTKRIDDNECVMELPLSESIKINQSTENFITVKNGSKCYGLKFLTSDNASKFCKDLINAKNSVDEVPPPPPPASTMPTFNPQPKTSTDTPIKEKSNSVSRASSSISIGRPKSVLVSGNNNRNKENLNSRFNANGNNNEINNSDIFKIPNNTVSSSRTELPQKPHENTLETFTVESTAADTNSVLGCDLSQSILNVKLKKAEVNQNDVVKSEPQNIMSEMQKKLNRRRDMIEEQTKIESINKPIGESSVNQVSIAPTSGTASKEPKQKFTPQPLPSPNEIKLRNKEPDKSYDVFNQVVSKPTNYQNERNSNQRRDSQISQESVAINKVNLNNLGMI